MHRTQFNCINIMDRIEKNVYYDSSIKLRSFKIILKRENFDKYRDKDYSEILLPECVVILSSSETDQLMKKISKKAKKAKQCNNNSNKGKIGTESARSLVAWLPTSSDMELPVLQKITIPE